MREPEAEIEKGIHANKQSNKTLILGYKLFYSMIFDQNFLLSFCLPDFMVT